MGLDIKAYEKVTLIRAMTVKEANYDPGERAETLLYVDHPSRTQHDGITDGSYAYDGAVFAFGAGSYRVYNRWRSMLARLVGSSTQAVWDEPADRRSGPFVELIGFSDCEGFIGPRTAAKLAKDFDAFAFRAQALDGLDSEWFRARYADWRKAFHLAAKGGAVKFH